MSFSEQLKTARKSVKMTQEQVAFALGINKSTYCGYETGKRRPDVERIRELASLFGVQADTLLEVDIDEARVVTDAEYRLITRYRVLDDSGKSFVETVMQREYQRVITSTRPHLTIAANRGEATDGELAELTSYAMEQARKLSD